VTADEKSVLLDEWTEIKLCRSMSWVVMRTLIGLIGRHQWH